MFPELDNQNMSIHSIIFYTVWHVLFHIINFLYINMGSLENKVWGKNIQANVSLGMQRQEI